jgi:hypothetical protein
MKKSSQIYQLRKLSTENYNDENEQPDKVKTNKNQSKSDKKIHSGEVQENKRRRAKKSILKTPSIGIKAIKNKGVNSPNLEKENLQFSLFKHLKNLSPLKNEQDYLSKC